MGFVGREEYLAKLDALWRKHGSSFAVVSGRRRIGKSTLVEEFARRAGCRFIEIAGLPPDRKMTNASIRLLTCLLKSQPEKTIGKNIQKANGTPARAGLIRKTKPSRKSMLSQFLSA